MVDRIRYWTSKIMTKPEPSSTNGRILGNQLNMKIREIEGGHPVPKNSIERGRIRPWNGEKEELAILPDPVLFKISSPNRT
jgi:hypothetical protein